MLSKPNESAACLVLNLALFTHAATGKLTALATSTKPAPIILIGANSEAGFIANGSFVTFKLAAFIIVALISKALRSGCASRIIATAPAVIGPEKDVPETGLVPV